MAFAWFDFAYLKRVFGNEKYRKSDGGYPKKLTTYLLMDGGECVGVCAAPTKSEARAKFKEQQNGPTSRPNWRRYASLRPGLKVVKE